MGIGRLTLVDMDTIDVTSLNRHALAGPADIGMLKSVVVARELTRLCPDTAVEPRELFVDSVTLPQILVPRPTLVVDAIDGVGPKVALLHACASAQIPTVTSLGASSRTDPTQLAVGDVLATHGCPLARQVRKRLRQLGVRQGSGIIALYSTEPAAAPIEPDDDSVSTAHGRVRGRQPSGPSMPAVFGHAAGSVVLQLLATGVGSH